jgi:hypothetical protein
VNARLWWRRVHGALRIGVAALLGFQALAFLFAGRHVFVRMGYPDSARIALAVLEAAAAVLAIIPRTFVVGAVGLVAVLAWAAGFHFALHQKTALLFADIALLALLLAGQPSREKPGEGAA